MSAHITIQVNTGNVPAFILKAAERQRIVKSYLKGDIGTEQLQKYGIKFTNPFSPKTTI